MKNIAHLLFLSESIASSLKLVVGRIIIHKKEYYLLQKSLFKYVMINYKKTIIYE